jgi:cyclophilin family peptidyl-prolyl cis-trans isomerase
MNRKMFSFTSALFLSGFFLLAGCTEEPAPKLGNAGKVGDEAVTPPASAPAAATPKSELKPSVLISTGMGDITVALYDDTPKHRDNFLKLAKEGYYNGTLFHRVIPTFMIQGGDPDSKNASAPAGSLGNGGPGYTIPAEIVRTHFHKRGALAAARTSDEINPKRESSGSQFYIVHGTTFDANMLGQMEGQMKASVAPNFAFTPEERSYYSTYGGAPHLDQQYTVFGEVVTGMDVVDKIAQVAQGPNNQPVKPVSMKVSLIAQ